MSSITQQQFEKNLVEKYRDHLQNLDQKIIDHFQQIAYNTNKHLKERDLKPENRYELIYEIEKLQNKIKGFGITDERILKTKEHIENMSILDLWTTMGILHGYDDYHNRYLLADLFYQFVNDYYSEYREKVFEELPDVKEIIDSYTFMKSYEFDKKVENLAFKSHEIYKKTNLEIFKWIAIITTRFYASQSC